MSCFWITYVVRTDSTYFRTEVLLDDMGLSQYCFHSLPGLDPSPTSEQDGGKSAHRKDLVLF